MTPADPPDYPAAANDNSDMVGLDPEALRKVNDVALQLARIIGRRMAREDFAARVAAANDNAPAASDGARQDADDEHRPNGDCRALRCRSRSQEAGISVAESLTSYGMSVNCLP